MVLAVIYRLSTEYFNVSGELPMEVFMGTVLIATGLWTKLTAEDFYVDKEGRKKYLDIENSLFFIKMKTWALILPSIGLGLIIYGAMMR
jgi:hypothetical protein